MQNKKRWTSYMLQGLWKASTNISNKLVKVLQEAFGKWSPAQPWTIVKTLYHLVLTNADDWDWILRTNISAGILHCRIKYWRVPEPIKEGKEELAKYWKKHYNTEEGALELTEGKL
jgi:hypothetical protein